MVRSLRIGHRRFVLSPGVNTVGREPNSTVCINDASVSRGHARITIKDNDVILEDLKSKNGTQVMGEPIDGPTPLKDGDEVEFGHVKGWFIVEAGEDPPTTTGIH
jgi:pSer/pThr/pTyr-binding forkhead associated (FHA) protein